MGQARRAREAARKTVALAYIHPGQVSSYFTESLLATVFYDFAQEAMGNRPRRIANVYQEWSSANVSEARNSVTKRFSGAQRRRLAAVDRLGHAVVAAGGRRAARGGRPE
jgi:GTP cyclohydrolase I